MENKVDNTVISSYGYSVNSLGQRTGANQVGTAFASTRTTDWGYDSKGEVTKADSSVTGLDRAYQYDGIGNRMKSADSLTLPNTDNYTVNAYSPISVTLEGIVTFVRLVQERNAEAGMIVTPDGIFKLVRLLQS